MVQRVDDEVAREGRTIEVGVEVDTEAVDDALEKVDALGDATAGLSPLVTIRNNRNCTFNIHPSVTHFVTERVVSDE